MRLLVIHCHPVPESFGSAIRDEVLDAAEKAGHALRLRDLYAEGFDPVMGAQERRDYHTAGLNEAPVRDHLDDLRWAEGLIFTYPTWWYGQPAMLKGWLDRVWVPHVVFTMPDATTPLGPALTNVRLIGAVSTLGSPWWLWRLMGQPGRRILLSGVRGCCHPRCRTFWLGLHGMDSATDAQRAAFLARVRRRIARIA